MRAWGNDKNLEQDEEKERNSFTRKIVKNDEADFYDNLTYMFKMEKSAKTMSSLD